MANIHKALTEEQLLEFKEIFNLVDKDGSGEITKYELGNLMDTLGLKATDEQLDQMMKEVDKDGSGDIDFNEFVTVMSRKVQEDFTPEQLKAAFKVFETADTEEGYVKTDVLEYALITYGEERMDPTEAAELLSAIDPDFTGKINYIEYIQSISHDSK